VVLNKRERIIALVTGGVIALLAADRLVLTPLVERSSRVTSDLGVANAELARAEQLFRNAPRMNQRWNQMIAAGMKPEVTESESQGLRALYDWAQASGVTVQSLQPDRVERPLPQKEFRQVTLRATGTGSLSAVGKLLWRVQTAPIPMRVTSLDLNSRKEGTDDLTVTLTVSTLVYMPPAIASAAGATPGGPAGANRGATR
jgi:hypothetical protein